MVRSFSIFILKSEPDRAKEDKHLAFLYYERTRITRNQCKKVKICAGKALFYWFLILLKNTSMVIFLVWFDSRLKLKAIYDQNNGSVGFGIESSVFDKKKSVKKLQVRPLPPGLTIWPLVIASIWVKNKLLVFHWQITLDNWNLNLLIKISCYFVTHVYLEKTSKKLRQSNVWNIELGNELLESQLKTL